MIRRWFPKHRSNGRGWARARRGRDGRPERPRGTLVHTAVSLTQYYTATTLDGFIADPDNSLDWLFTRQREDDGPQNYGASIAAVGALAMGATTDQWILDHEFKGKDPSELEVAVRDPVLGLYAPAARGRPDANVEFTSTDVAARTRRWCAPQATGTSGSSAGATWPASSRRGAPGRGERVDRAGHAGRGRASCPAGSSRAWTSSDETAISSRRSSQRTRAGLKVSTCARTGLPTCVYKKTGTPGPACPG